MHLASRELSNLEPWDYQLWLLLSVLQFGQYFQLSALALNKKWN
jgi:hypothetical protein